MAKKGQGKKKPAKALVCRLPVRTPSGIKGLDKLIGGGFLKNSTVMVRGDSGTGKTIFALQFLYNGATEHDEPGLYISFSESEDVLCQHGNSFGWDIQGLVEKDMFAILRYEPHEVANIVSEGGGSIRDTVESLGAKRIVIDSLTAYKMVFETEYKSNESVLGLFELLKKWNATVLVTSEVPVSPKHESGGRLGFLTDGIINLYHMRQNGQRGRTLEVIKMRDTDHDTHINVFGIGKNGIEVTTRWKNGRKK